MGFEDVLNERPYTTTVRCISTTGTVYCINKTNFFEKCKKDEKSYKKLFKVSDDMDIKTQTKIRKAHEQISKINGQQKK